MKRNEILESKNLPTYHITSTESVSSILSNNRFRLTGITNDSEARLWKKDSPVFFMSLTRSKVGRYTLSTVHEGAAILELDTKKLSHNYTMKPVDYWSAGVAGFDEMEERLFSKKQYIDNAVAYIKSIHIKVPVIEKLGGSRLSDIRMIKMVKSILMTYRLAKQNSIPVYLYERIQDIIKMDKKTSNEYILKYLKDFVRKAVAEYGYQEQKRERISWKARYADKKSAKRYFDEFHDAIVYQSVPLVLLAKLVMYPNVPEDQREREKKLYELQSDVKRIRREDYIGSLLRGYDSELKHALMVDLQNNKQNEEMMEFYYRLLNYTGTKSPEGLMNWVKTKWKL